MTPDARKELNSGPHNSQVCLNCKRMSKALEAAAQMNGTYATRVKHLELALAEWEKERLFQLSEIARLRSELEAR